MLECLDPLGLPGPVVNWVYFEPNHGVKCEMCELCLLG